MRSRLIQSLAGAVCVVSLFGACAVAQEPPLPPPSTLPPPPAPPPAVAPAPPAAGAPAAAAASPRGQCKQANAGLGAGDAYRAAVHQCIKEAGLRCRQQAAAQRIPFERRHDFVKSCLGV